MALECQSVLSVRFLHTYVLLLIFSEARAVHDDGIDMDDEPEDPKNEKEVADHPAKNIPLAEKTMGTGQDKGIRQYADAPAERVSLKAKLETMKAKVAGGETEKSMPLKAKGKEENL